MSQKTRVTILENHQGIIDGYMFRLGNLSDIEIVATATYGEELEPLLVQTPTDVLLLDVHVPTSPNNQNPYPILHLIPKLLDNYPEMTILVISMHNQRKLIEAVMASGASGYIIKDDRSAIRDLASVIRSVAEGGIYMSQYAYQQITKGQSRPVSKDQTLSRRQVEVLSLCAAYPDAGTAELAKKLSVANSTIRNILSQVYLKLDVRSRAAAVAKARQLGWFPAEVQAVVIPGYTGEEN